MFYRCRFFLAPVRDPFKILGLSRTATRAEVKTKYRELARLYHPDGEHGDAVKMEQVNHAYKLLMKEGGYERLHLSGDGSLGGGAAEEGGGRRAEGVTASRRGRASTPFTVEQQGDTPSAAAPLTDEEVERVSALDPSTERRTATGKFMYQNRDDQSWVELDRPLLRANQPRYASFAAKKDMTEELRMRAKLREREENEKSTFQKTLDRLADSADLPTRNRHVLRVCFVLTLVVFYFMYSKTFARPKHHRERTQFYHNLEDEREELFSIYENYKDGLEVSVTAAAIIFLAASKQKTLNDPIIQPPPETHYHSIHPPASHFHVHAGI